MQRYDAVATQESGRLTLTRIKCREKLSLNRFPIEDVGECPAKLAFAIHEQLGHRDGPVQIVDIAYALDINSIRTHSLNGCEGALIMPPHKPWAAIVVNDGVAEIRQRFTIAHELGHFVNRGHKPLKNIGDNGFAFHCTKNDMRARGARAHQGLSAAQRKEVEANRFAAELLMPRYKLASYLKSSPNLKHVTKIANQLQVSREAAANRYVRTHSREIAIIFSKDDIIRYIAKRDDFPRTFVWNKQRLPRQVLSAGSGLSEISTAETDVWLSRPKTEYLEVQTLGQASGHQMTLLILPEH